ncbi:hypothetical protein A0J61_11211 [Choanephora cucurbitarum]|uniref:Uncharacterized protein n=1 Tax=Choanephora cucurbitarum TaxID=101091 RepID=A0A1C7MV90_9FUNG|nr:hypothetical protein A0J61_11211 [Choanephora cucurbitarum]
MSDHNPPLDSAATLSPGGLRGANFASPLPPPPPVFGLGLVTPSLQSRSVFTPSMDPPVEDTDDATLRSYFEHPQSKYLELLHYIVVGRGERQVRIGQLQERINLYGTLLPTMSAAQQAMFVPTVQETEMTLQQLASETALLEEMVEPEKDWIRNEVEKLTQQHEDDVKTLINDYDWPNMED